MEDNASGYQHGLRLKWCAGLDYNTPNSVINLSEDNKEEFCYISGHTAVIYNYEKKRQKLLQGHSNKITAITYSHSKRVIVTADTGEYNMVVVWSADNGSPLRTFFEVDDLGVKCMDISKDGRLILTLGQWHNGRQTIRVWDWLTEGEKPMVSEVHAKVNKPSEAFEFVKWNHSDYEEFATTGRHSVKFWRRDNEGGCQGYSPLPSKKEEHKGREGREFTQTIFVPENKGVQAVTGTNNGFLIVWDTILILEEFSNVNNRREIKSINLLNNSHKKYAGKVVSISLLNTYKDMIILGTSVGTIRFYDFRFRIICWFEENEMGAIRSLSFSYKDNGFDEYSKSDKIDDEEEELNFPEFIVCDTEACVFKLNASHFKEIDVNKKEAVRLFSSVKKRIIWTSVSPDSKIIAFTTADGKVYEWSMWSPEPTLIKNFETDSGVVTEVPTIVEYSPDSKYLIIGTNQGNVYVRSDLNTGLNVSPLLISHKKKGVVCEKLVFSNCSSYIAVADNHKCVSLFRLGHKYEDKSQPIEWVFSGKVRAHTSKITDLCFVRSGKEDPVPQLYSIGEDMFLVQYNIAKSKDYLIVDSYEKIEFNDFPTALCPYPPEYLKEPLLLIANSGYKLKLWNTAQSQKICRQTVLGPSFGGCVKNLKILNPNRTGQKHKYLAYSTMDKIIGIIKLPLDGNPNNYIGLISTSGQISHMSVSNNGKYIAIAGGEDLTLNIWRVDYDALEKNELLNTTVENPLDIYPSLLEGGEEGDLYRELKDFFYYSQIRRMEENSTKAHKLDGKIPLKEIPNLMIALGYYPTLKEIENMQNEVKYSKMDKNVLVDDLSLKDFVKLFINHRSAYGLTKDYIEDNLKDVFENVYNINSKEFIELLTKYGEKMSINDIKFYLNTLVGEGEVQELLGDNVSSEKLVKEVLGFELESEVK